MADGVRYIKVAKTDGAGVNQTNALQSLTKLTIPYSSGNVTYDILNISEFSTYFLYYVENPNIDFSERADVKYEFTGSFDTTDYYTGEQFKTKIPIPISSGFNDSFGFYSSTNLKYIFNTYAQKDLYLQATGSVEVSTSELIVSLYRLTSLSTDLEILTSSLTLPVGTQTFNIKYNLTSSLPGDEYGVSIRRELGTGTPSTASFKPATRFFITSSDAIGSSFLTVPEPYFTSNFSRAFDCQPLLNNAVRERSNPFLQDLDYQTSQTVPVNYQSVVSGSATKATVPESYYTSLAQTNIRYNGSKIQSEKINQWTKGTYQDGLQITIGPFTFARNSNVNIGTYGKEPSINSFDTDIYEFEWGGGTTPEILGWGSFKMGKILQVQTTESVRIVNASEGETSQVQAYPYYSNSTTIRDYRKLFGINANAGVSPNNATGSIGSLHFWTISQSISDYYYILNGNNPVNTEITPLMYPNPTAGSNPTIPKTTKIVTTEFGVPTISNYALTSSNAKYGEVGGLGTSENLNKLLVLDRTVDISKVTTDSNGFYQSGNPIAPNWATIGDQIVEDLNNNEKWFVTLYNEFEFPNGGGDYNSALTSGSLSPYNPGYNTLDSDGNYPNPLAYKGVYEIVGCWDNTATGEFNILLNTPIPSPTKNIGRAIPGNSLGMLLWKARSSNKSEFVIVQDEVTGGVGAGAFMNKYSPQELIDNFDTITRNFGNNVT